MFNLSMAKILVVLGVALIVLGPERLPPLIRQAGRWLGHLKAIRESVESEVRGAFSDIPGVGSEGSTGISNPLAGVENPFAGLHESVSSIGQSLRSVLGTGTPLAEGVGVSQPKLPPPGHANRNSDGSGTVIAEPSELPPFGGSGLTGAQETGILAGQENKVDPATGPGNGALSSQSATNQMGRSPVGVDGLTPADPSLN
ncbi:MAG TPA: twin-arginine translocase TatA/TatE family subunit [Acidimicrobiales bacterium]|nr:twin-arginine translocase TatA/TatE family subunit [Acidimicrobiales bacterium]